MGCLNLELLRQLKLGCSQQAVSLIAKKFEKEQTLRTYLGVADQETSPREDRNIKFTSLKDRRLTGKAIALKHEEEIS